MCLISSHYKKAHKKQTYLYIKPTADPGDVHPVNFPRQSKHSLFSIALKTGVAFNQSKEINLFQRDAFAASTGVTIDSITNKNKTNMPLYVDLTYHPTNMWLSWTLSGVILPEHKVRTVVNAHDSTPSLYYLNTALSSYGIMGRLNLEYTSHDYLIYMTGGAGALLNKVENSYLFIRKGCDRSILTLFGDDKLNFAWQLGGGFKYRLSEGAYLDIGYMFINKGKVKTKDAVDFSGRSSRPILFSNASRGAEFVDLISHQILIGISHKL